MGDILRKGERKALTEFKGAVDSLQEGHGEKWFYDMGESAVKNGETLVKTIERLLALLAKKNASTDS